MAGSFSSVILLPRHLLQFLLGKFMKLREALKCDDLTNNFCCLVDHIKRDYLRFWQMHEPHYTDHGEDHCKTVESNLDELIPESIKKTLNEYEIFILLCSVWLHDMGIMIKRADESVEDIRSTHHIRSAEFIMKKFSDLLNEAERVVMAAISRAHRSVVDLSTLDERISLHHPTLGNQHIRVRFLAALLRLADACDICHTRAAVDTSGLPEEARFYHLLHRRVSGINFVHNKASIEINMLVESDFDRVILSDFVTGKLSSELDSVREGLSSEGIFYFYTKEFFSNASVPSIEVPSKMLEDVRLKLSEDVHLRLRSGGDPTPALEAAKKLYSYGEKISFEIILMISRSYREGNDLKAASETLEFGLTLYPDNITLLYELGFLKSDYLCDDKGSFECFEKIFKNRKDENVMGNLAEAYVRIKKYDDAYDLATQLCETSSDLNFLINSRLIQIWSLYLMGKEKDGSDMIRALTLIFPKNFHKINTWVYNGISKFLQKSDLKPSVKEMLLNFIDVVSNGKSIEEFKSTYLG